MSGEKWDRTECPVCESIDKVRSELGSYPDEWRHVCDRCNLQWWSDAPIDERV